MKRPTVKILKWNVMILFAAMLTGCVTQNCPDGDGPPNVEAEAIARTITEWLEPYQTFGIKTKQEGGTTYLYATLGKVSSIFNSLQLTFAIDAEARDVVCYGFLPTVVPEERRKDMVEFIFRGEWGYGISPASMVLDSSGGVRCQAWMPFESFARQPKETKLRLLGAVVDKLCSFSEGVASVSLGGKPADAVARIVRRTAVLGGLSEVKELAHAAKTDTKTVLERCFDKDAQATVVRGGNPWMQKLSGQGDDVSVGIISGHFEDVVRDMGGRYDVLPYSLIVREGMVWNVCAVPDAVPDEIIDKAADWAMRMNEGLKSSFFSVDFDAGKMWSHYGLPVSALPPSGELPPRNLYGALIKIIPVLNVAARSEDLHLALVKALLRTDDSEGAALSSMESLSRQAGTVATWLRGHLKDTKWKVATNGVGRIGVSGLVRGHGPNVDDCSFSLDLDDVGGYIVCRGAPSKAVPEARLAEVQNLLFHYGFKNGVSIGAVALDKDRRVQCSASIPLLALRDDPNGTVCRLATNVLIPALELSEAVTRICRDGQKPEEALDAVAFPRERANSLQDPDADDDACDATSEEEKVIESWFGAEGVRYERGIESELTVYYRDKGNVGQGLRECFVMCGKMVLAQCRLKLEIPEGRRKAVNAFALAYNATNPTVKIHLGHVADPGDLIYFQYVMPVSVLQARKRNTVAKEHFNRMLNTAHRSALEMSAKIQEIVRGDAKVK